MFIEAKPIFPIGKSDQKNIFACFRTTLRYTDAENVQLFITASSFYQLWVNSNFIAFGPARTAKGYARVDCIPLDKHLKKGENEILVLVVSYGCRSCSTVLQKAFFQAEIRQNERVIRASGRDFEAFLPPHKLQRVKRYAKQRHFSEVWDYRCGLEFCNPAYKTEIEVLVPAPQLIPRTAPYPYYEDISSSGICSKGVLVFDETLPFRSSPYSNELDERWGIFKEESILFKPYEWIQRRKQIKTQSSSNLPVTLQENEYAIFDFSQVETGFIQLLATSQEEADIVIGFSEDASGDEFVFTNLNAYNAIEILFDKDLHFTSFEPYVGRYFIVAVRKGAITLERFGIKTFTHDPNGVLLNAPTDPTLRLIFNSALRTFLHNAVDLYMDCPSRERAGWLCDSYFMGKTEYALFGNTFVEDAFLENYRLFKNEGEYPKGALPMCYPSDESNENTFIPQWTMWYILEVEEYVNARGHQKDRELFRKTVEDLLTFYEGYENEDGLLEDLPSRNFVEWSAANTWTKNVNYPTNFLYAQALEAAYRLFGNETHLKRSEQIRKKAIAQSFDGFRFYDHAVRNEQGELILQKDCSEIAQYYAILFGGFDINKGEYAPLKELVIQKCTTGSTNFPTDIEPINLFIGVYLRIEALLKLKEYDLVLKDIRLFFGEMGAKTGTLWEHRQTNGSRNHGFASYVLVAMLRALKKN